MCNSTTATAMTRAEPAAASDGAVNPLIGDASWVETYGAPPPPDTPDVLRLVMGFCQAGLFTVVASA